MPKDRTRGSAEDAKLPYNANMDYPTSTMLPLPQSDELCQRLRHAYTKLLLEGLLGVSLSLEEVDTELQWIASKYFIRRSNFSQNRLPVERKRATRVSKNVSNIQRDLASPTLRTAFNSETRHLKGALQDLELLLGRLAKACEAVQEIKAPNGPRPVEHIDTAVLALARVFQDASGSRFSKNRTINPESGDFAFEGAEFVFQMLNAMDPNIRRNEVEAAISRLHLERLHIG